MLLASFQHKAVVSPPGAKDFRLESNFIAGTSADLFARGSCDHRQTTIPSQDRVPALLTEIPLENRLPKW
jgi:hypothetical protein